MKGIRAFRTSRRTDMKRIGAQVGGTTPDKEKVHTPLLGGGFGRTVMKLPKR
ncbi:MAG: hypothetical protein J2P54_02065 [Bradyrhizobiaceae bacterium]|nr:hypothetical protein [Bradyrhizobiaceae bacterium]